LRVAFVFVSADAAFHLARLRLARFQLRLEPGYLVAQIGDRHVDPCGVIALRLLQRRNARCTMPNPVRALPPRMTLPAIGPIARCVAAMPCWPPSLLRGAY
jgi:hypothetical protein